ncbi:hypothetical protein GIB67_015285 [Kingdonia uniflora]|uniref:DUF659 domain-containing protein n=1 Tax=Kingdonia uniflora TaxID=39325 RepID=A0A7J7MSQ4_9MAGN|nr:hypothetical protein GIB67_015285 [Kingdonia uniflora]
MRSADISDSIGNVNALVLLIEQVIEEIGAENVVQVVTFTMLGCMEEVDKQFAEKRMNIFWTVCASHCICLMLEKFETMSFIKEVTSKAMIITKFLYSRETILKLVSKHVSERSLVNSSRIRSVRPSLTLENIVLEKENLQKMFGSSAWNTSIWASRADGKRVDNRKVVFLE